MPHIIGPRELLAHAERANPFATKEAEARLYALGLTLLFMAGLLLPTIYLLTQSDATLAQIARANRGEHLVAGIFFCCAMVTLPHAVALAFLPHTLGIRWPRQWGAGAAAVAALVWIYLGTAAVPLGFAFEPITYIGKALGCIVVGLVYGLSLNGQQVRDNENPVVVD